MAMFLSICSDLAELVNTAADAVMERIQATKRVPRSLMIASRL
jgi:hypothetical protein